MWNNFEILKRKEGKEAKFILILTEAALDNFE